MTEFLIFAGLMNELMSGNFWEEGIEENDFLRIMNSYKDIVANFDYNGGSPQFTLNNGIRICMNTDEGGAYYWYFE